MEDIVFAKDRDKANRRYLTDLWNLPAQNKNFTGRKDLLDQITERLSGLKSLVITACHGLGGVGKTQLVIEYAYRNKKKYERMIWIPSESSGQIEATYLALGRDLQIVSDGTPSAEAVYRVKLWLSNHPQNLIIFDNAQDYKTVQNYIVPSGADVLITSRYTEWPEKGIEVDLFSPEDAALYFKKVVGTRVGDTDAVISELVVKELHRLPLAIAQAAAYIRENPIISIQEYLIFYRDKKKYFLSKNILPAGEHHVSVYLTWNITMERIKQESELAEKLMFGCAFLHSGGIQDFILCNLIGENFEEAAALLNNYSIITVADTFIKVHELVQEVLRLSFDTNSYTYFLNLALSAILNRMVEYDFARLDSVKSVEDVIAHANSLALYCEPGGVDKSNKEKFLVTLVSYYLDFRQSTSVEKLCKMLFEVQQSLYGDNEPMRLIITLNRWAENLYYAGNYPSSAEMFQKSLCLLKKQPLTDEVEIKVAETDSLYADVIAKQGYYKEAQKLHEASLKTLERIYNGEATQLSADVLHALGNALYNQTDYSGAEEFFERALEARKKCYRLQDSNHPRLARTLHMLGCVYLKRKEYKNFFGKLQEALSIEKKNLGKIHADVAKSYRSLGELFLAQGELEKAQRYGEKSLAIQEILYPMEDHPQVARSQLFLAQIAMKTGNVVFAKMCREKALGIFEKKLGLRNHETVACQKLLDESQLNITMMLLGSTVLPEKSGDIQRDQEKLEWKK